MIRTLALCLALVGTPAAAQHAHGDHSAAAGPTEPGQSAFAALAEIVALLRADPATDWHRVDIPALREHLVDMDLVTLDATVATTPTATGAVFRVGGEGRTLEAVRRMALAHPPFAEAETGWTIVAEPVDGGVELAVDGDRDQILALGFHGLMTLGAHHEAHHLAIARGDAPHE